MATLSTIKPVLLVSVLCACTDVDSENASQHEKLALTCL